MPVVVHTELFVRLGDILQFPRHFACKFRMFLIQRRRGAVGMLKNSLIEAANQTAKQPTNEAIFSQKQPDGASKYTSVFHGTSLTS